jgi:hypothetical protein
VGRQALDRRCLARVGGGVWVRHRCGGEFVRFVRLPLVAIVPRSDVERLQRKFTEAKTEAERDRFWLAVQRSKQPSTERPYYEVPF